MTHAVESEQHPRDDEAADPLEDSELAQRLRRMEWPSAPPEVKERCLEEILRRVTEGEDGNAKNGR